jgi:hypothetical protein
MMRLLRGSVVLLCLLIASQGQAQTLLRWKLKTGDEFIVSTQQRTESNVFFSGKSAKSKIETQMDIRWTVREARESSFVVKQAIERLSTTLLTATGSAEYDSGAKTRPVGLAKQLSDALAPLVGAEIEIEMNDRGEVLAVKAANAAAEALFKADASDTGGNNSRSAVRQVVSQSILQLPKDDVDQQGEWQAVRELDTPAGLLRQETTYKLADFVDREGMRLGQIESRSDLAPPAVANGTEKPVKGAIKIVNHEQSGTILFSIEQGRVIESQQQQKLVTERAYRDTTITVTLESTQTSTVK